MGTRKAITDPIYINDPIVRMGNMPYKLDPNYVYLFGRRGDIKSLDSKFTGQRDGMIGYIDSLEWDKEVWLSDFTLRRMFVAKVPRNWKAAILPLIVPGGKDTKGKELPVKSYLDYSSYASLKTVDGRTINNPESMIHSPILCPVWDFELSGITTDTLKDATSKDWGATPSLIDFHAISSGSYTIGGGGGDDYPTINGAGGFFADFAATITGNLTGTINSNISENATTTPNSTVNAGVTVCVDCASPHVGDPTAGYLVSTSSASYGIYETLRALGANAIVEYRNFRIKRTAGTQWIISNEGTGASTLIRLNHDLIIDGNGIATRGFMCWGSNFGASRNWNIIVHDCTTYGIQCVSSDADNTDIFENCLVDNCGTGFNCGNFNSTWQNCLSYDNTTDWSNKSNATGKNNGASDATATGGWATDVDNSNNRVFANDCLSTDSTNANYCDIDTTGTLVGAGIANIIPERTDCIRGRTVPRPSTGLTSIGVAEVADAPVPPTPSRGNADWAQSRISIPVGIGCW